MQQQIDSPAIEAGRSFELSGKDGTMVHLQKGKLYKVTVPENEKLYLKKVSADALGNDMVALREGDALILQHADGTQLFLEGFYASPDAAVELSLGDESVYTLSSAAESALSDNSRLLYTYNDQSFMRGISSETLTDAPPAVMASTDAATVAAGSGVAEAGMGFSTMAMAGLGALAVGGVAAAGGGGADETTIQSIVPLPSLPTTISISVAPHSSIVEGTLGIYSATYVLTRQGDTALKSTVKWHVSGTVNGADFIGGDIPSGTVTFAPGETSKTVEILLNADPELENNETLIFSIEDPVNAILRGTISVTTTIKDDDFPHAVSVLSPAAFNTSLSLSGLDSIPDDVIGNTYRMGSNVSVIFTAATGGSIFFGGQELPFNITDGTLSFTLGETSYSYRLLGAANDWNAVVLGSTDADLSGAMNEANSQTPPAILTLASTELTAQPLPTSGILSLCTTGATRFGDYGSSVKTDIDFETRTIKTTDIQGNTSTVSFTVDTQTDTIRYTDSAGNSFAWQLLSTIDSTTEADFYILSETSTTTFNMGDGSAEGAATISEWLLANDGYVWRETGSDLNGNGTTDDYARILDTDGTVDYTPSSTLVFDSRNELGTVDVSMAVSIENDTLHTDSPSKQVAYSIDTANDALLITQTQSDQIGSFAASEPFVYEYVTELAFADGTYSVSLHDGMSLSLSELGAYEGTLIGIDALSDTAANTITVDATDILASGGFTTPAGETYQMGYVAGGPNDMVDLGSGWTLSGTQENGLITYNIYVNSAADTQLLITHWTQVI